MRRDFPRVGRLFEQLPLESRAITRINPLKDWDWDKEMQSQILRQLGLISDQLGKFGSNKRPKAPKQLQPKYVEEAKKELEKREAERKRWTKQEKNALAAFFQKRNPKARIL